VAPHLTIRRSPVLFDIITVLDGAIAHPLGRIVG